jgi:hypothetical protein
MPQSLFLGRDPVPTYRRLGGPQGQSWWMQKISTPVGFDPQTVQTVVSCYNNYATLATQQDFLLLRQHPKIWWNWKRSWKTVRLQADADTHDLNMKTFKALQYSTNYIQYEPWSSNAIIFNNTPSQYTKNYLPFTDTNLWYLLSYDHQCVDHN